MWVEIRGSRENNRGNEKKIKEKEMFDIATACG